MARYWIDGGFLPKQWYGQYQWCNSQVFCNRFNFSISISLGKVAVITLFQCFLTGWMIHPRVNKIVARLNETSGVNERWMKFMFLIFVSSENMHLSCLWNIPAIVNKISNFKRSINFASAGVSNLALQKNCSLVQLTESKKSLLSSFQIAHVLMKRKKTFCEVESVTKPYLEIVANLLHGGKHSVDKVEQIPWFNNEHSMCYDYCHVGLRCTIGRMGMQQLLSGVNENKEVKKHCVTS